MFWNIYSKRLLSAFRDKSQLFWVLLFPIALATLFYVTLSNVDAAERLETIPVGVVVQEEGESIFQEVLKETKNGKKDLFKAETFSGEEEADSALKEGDIAGYYLPGQESIKLIVKDDGISQTVLKSFLDQYIQTEAAVASMAKTAAENGYDLTKITGKEWAQAGEGQELTEPFALSKNPGSSVLNYYYALLALVCLYGSMQGMDSVKYLQGNLSALGARRMMVPTGRFRLVCYDLLAGMTVQMVDLLAVMLYITVILRVDFGGKTGLLVLTGFVGNLLGVGFGAAVGCISKAGEAMKSGIMFAFSLVCCFGAGMMVEGMRYLIDRKAPVISWLNPAARISDAFYCLYYFDDYKRYLLNIAVMLAMTAVFFILTGISLRRQQYESI